MTSTYVIDGCTVATVDAGRTVLAGGHVVVEDERISAVAAGPAPQSATTAAGARVVDGRGCLLTPGFVNTHHHLYQWATRGLAVDATLFEWLTALYPVWAGIDAETVHAAALGGLAMLARTGCTTTTDHHYVFPSGQGDLLAPTVEAASRIGLRFHPTRGSMDLGRSRGGLPPDSVVEDIDAVLAATQQAIDDYHDPAPGAMVRIGVAPCSPFSASGELMRASAELARRDGVRMHTHLCETRDEDAYCHEHFGCTPIEYADSLGWLGPDVWLAHAVHLSDADIEALARTGTAFAHCPSSNARLGSGIARVHDARAAGVSIGLGVDGAASNESGSLLEEVRMSVMVARARGGPTELAVMDALEMATMGGARVIGRADEIGSIEPGKLADLALWRLDGFGHADVVDPVAALVLGSPAPLELLLVQGRPVVERDRLVLVDEDEVAGQVVRANRHLLSRAAG